MSQTKALAAIRQERQAPFVPPALLDAFQSDLSGIVRKNKDKAGLAVVVGMVSNGPCGVEQDLDNMKQSFEELDIAVWQLSDASSVKITGVIQTIGQYPFPSNYKFIFVYATGHGGSVDNHTYITTAGDTDDDGRYPKLYIEEAIITPLLPKNTPNLKDLVRRIFLFDCCLVDNTKKDDAQVIKKEDVSVPPKGNVLVAYATSLTASARADADKGGVWTRYLARNMVEVDLPFTTVLDLTWEDTVKHFNIVFEQEVREGTMEVQGPHYTSCAGLMWLRHPEWDLTTCREHLHNRKPALETSLNNPIARGMNNVAQPPPTTGDIHPPQDLQLIANMTPKHGDMMNALSDVHCEWERILMSLQVPFPKISTIKREQQSDFMRLASGLHAWIAARYSSPTWQGLIKALLDCDLIDAVFRVEERMREKYKDYSALA